MVLQQKDRVAFWGKYTPEREVKVTGSWGEESTSTSDRQGKWLLKLNTPDAGGPYTVKIETQDSLLVINDVLIGEVWLASGQSNMEMPMKGFSETDSIEGGKQEIANADNTNIRMLTVANRVAVSPIDTLIGQWEVASPNTVGNFSATAYFFAKRLYNELKVPIGIIHTSWGGTEAEAWTSERTLRTLGDFDKAIDRLKNKDSQKDTKEWLKHARAKALPQNDAQWNEIDFNDREAAQPDFDDSQWETIELPGRFDSLKSNPYDGAVWFRKTFTIDNPDADYELTIGAVDDMDATYINGQKVGGIAGVGYWTITRHMHIPKNLLIKGTNTIAIRAIDTGGPGLIVAPIVLTNNKDSISLAGEWKQHVIAEIIESKFYVYTLDNDLSERPNIFQFSQNLPTVLYNGMLHPLIPFTIKGAIWYQGEANVGRAEQYKRLFPAMIDDWRTGWGYEFPYYYVQIAPFLYATDPSQQVSQELRDAQRYALKTPKTGMVVTLDIGNPNNIHPSDKKDVGERLAGLALANDYSKNLEASGPLFESATPSGNKIIIKFSHIGSGLMASENGLTDFEIAGADKKYMPASAEIVDNTVVVQSEQVPEPKFVRYTWSDAPSASLFNKEGLPASTFTSEK